ncbi:MAG: hypothetical protein ABIS69_10760 [Sediminibacterium sp.]
MKKMLVFCFFFIVGYSAMTQSASPTPAVQATQSVTPREICDAALGFLNQLSSGAQFSKVIGTIAYKSNSYGMEYREYNSLQNFPGAKKTTIVDTSGLSHYRSAKALMYTETVSSNKLTKDAAKYFDIISEMLKNCLVPQKFEEDYSPQLVKLHELKMAFRYKMPSKDAGPFSNMQMGNTLVLEVYIDQTKNMDGTFTNEVYLHFKRV